MQGAANCVREASITDFKGDYMPVWNPLVVVGIWPHGDVRTEKYILKLRKKEPCVKEEQQVLLPDIICANDVVNLGCFAKPSQLKFLRNATSAIRGELSIFLCTHWMHVRNFNKFIDHNR
jgi:hypothetical protein